MGLSCMVYSFALPKLSPNSLKYCYKTDIWCQGSSKTLAEFSSKGPGSQYFGDSKVKWSLLQLINSAIMEQKQPQTLCKHGHRAFSMCDVPLSRLQPLVTFWMSDVHNVLWQTALLSSYRRTPMADFTVSPFHIWSRSFPAACCFSPASLSFPQKLLSHDVHEVGQLRFLSFLPPSMFQAWFAPRPSCSSLWWSRVSRVDLMHKNKQQAGFGLLPTVCWSPFCSSHKLSRTFYLAPMV